LVIVIAVPAAETVSSHLLASVSPSAPASQPAAAAPKLQPVAASKPVAKPAPAIVPKQVAETAPVATAQSKVEPAAAPAGPAVEAEARPAPAAPAAGKDVVKDYLAVNKTLPSYIVSAPGKATTTQAAQPAELTPAAQRLAAKLASAPEPPGATLPPTETTAVASANPVVPKPEAPPLPMPPSARPKPQPVQTVTEADLKDWKSGSLEDYLKSHGLLSNAEDAPAGGF
jgi:hypothetical protein